MGSGRIAIVGAGSAAFGPSVLAGLARCPALDGVALALHDIDGAAVARMGRLARLVAEGAGTTHAVEATTELARALEGADVVVLSVAVDREATWQEDRAIGLRHGIDHYAENGGPGALFHTARNLAIIMPIVREMERRCPDAWLLNYTNPVPRIATAIRRYSRVRSLGVCHQLGFGYYMVGVLLAAELGLALPPDPRFRWTDEASQLEHRLSAAARERVFLRAAGLNHFTWALDVRGRRDGRDLYPTLREASRRADPGFEPLSRRVFDLYGLFPTSGDAHVLEYLPYTHDVARATWQRYDIQMYDFAWARARRRDGVALIERVLAAGDVAAAAEFPSERAEELAAALLHRAPHTDEALNLPNGGAIANLPADAIVEVPVQFLPTGPHPIVCGPLPEPVAELCRRQIAITELAVAGIVEADRTKLRQALALDPMISDPDLPDRLLDASLHAFEHGGAAARPRGPDSPTARGPSAARRAQMPGGKPKRPEA